MKWKNPPFSPCVWVLCDVMSVCQTNNIPFHSRVGGVLIPLFLVFFPLLKFDHKSKKKLLKSEVKQPQRRQPYDEFLFVIDQDISHCLLRNHNGMLRPNTNWVPKTHRMPVSWAFGRQASPTHFYSQTRKRILRMSLDSHSFRYIPSSDPDAMSPPDSLKQSNTDVYHRTAVA